MKKILVFFLLVICCIPASAEVCTLKNTSLSSAYDYSLNITSYPNFSREVHACTTKSGNLNDYISIRGSRGPDTPPHINYSFQMHYEIVCNISDVRGYYPNYTYITSGDSYVASMLAYYFPATYSGSITKQYLYAGSLSYTGSRLQFNPAYSSVQFENCNINFPNYKSWKVDAPTLRSTGSSNGYFGYQFRNNLTFYRSKDWYSPSCSVGSIESLSFRGC